MIWLRIAKPADLEALGDGRRMQRAVPDVGDVAGEQRPGLAPVGAVVVQHLAGAAGRGGAGLVAPGRIVVDAVGRVGDHQLRLDAVEQALDVGRHRGVAAEQPVRAEQPEIAGQRDRVLRRLGDVVLVVAGTGGVLAQQPVRARRRRSRSAAGRSRRAAGRRARGRAAPRPTRRSRWRGCPSAGRPAPAPGSGRGRCAPAPRSARAAAPPRAGCGRRGSPSPRRRRSAGASRTPSARRRRSRSRAALRRGLRA